MVYEDGLCQYIKIPQDKCKEIAPSHLQSAITLQDSEIARGWSVILIRTIQWNTGGVLQTRYKEIQVLEKFISE